MKVDLTQKQALCTLPVTASGDISKSLPELWGKGFGVLHHPLFVKLKYFCLQRPLTKAKTNKIYNINGVFSPQPPHYLTNATEINKTKTKIDNNNKAVLFTSASSSSSPPTTVSKASTAVSAGGMISARYLREKVYIFLNMVYKW